jgi:hypothetical protein
MANAHAIGDEVEVVASSETEKLGVAGARGRVVGGSYENDDLTGRIRSYAVEIGEPDEARVWMIEPGGPAGSPDLTS